MGDISNNFSRHEFACKCGCGFDTVDVITVQLCEDVREFDGNTPKTPSSGCRCKKYNRAEGGSEKSEHLFGRAGDLHCNNPELVYKKLCEKYPNQYGFGLYEWGVHADSRSGRPARWVELP